MGEVTAVDYNYVDVCSSNIVWTPVVSYDTEEVTMELVTFNDNSVCPIINAEGQLGTGSSFEGSNMIFLPSTVGGILFDWAHSQLFQNAVYDKCDTDSDVETDELVHHYSPYEFIALLCNQNVLKTSVFLFFCFVFLIWLKISFIKCQITSEDRESLCRSEAGSCSVSRDPSYNFIKDHDAFLGSSMVPDNLECALLETQSSINIACNSSYESCGNFDSAEKVPLIESFESRSDEKENGSSKSNDTVCQPDDCSQAENATNEEIYNYERLLDPTNEVAGAKASENASLVNWLTIVAQNEALVHTDARKVYNDNTYLHSQPNFSLLRRLTCRLKQKSKGFTKIKCVQLARKAWKSCNFLNKALPIENEFQVSRRHLSSEGSCFVRSGDIEGIVENEVSIQSE